MYSKEFTTRFPPEILPEVELGLHSVHFSNRIILQIRYNGEMDTTYEVVPRGLQPFSRPLAGISSDENDEDEYLGDHMADWQVICRLGDSNDTKMPVICTQIGELYRKVVLPSNVDHMSHEDEVQSRGLVITLSSKLWRSDDKSFDKLVFVLKSLKKMYS